MFCLTIPSLTLDIEHRSSKGGCAGTFSYVGVVMVTQPGVALPLGVPLILAEDHICQGDWSYTLQHLDLRGDTVRGIRTEEQTLSQPYSVTFSSLTSSGLVVGGFSMATRQSIWRR